MKRLIVFFIISLFFLSLIPVVLSQTDRFAACDLCGYCPPNPPPQTWERCVECIYPQASTDPSVKETLLINPKENIPPTPHPGRQYTMLGCIQTNLGSFRQEGAAASVVQTLLNLIFSTVGGVAFLFLLYGAFVITTSQANPERLNHGKRIVFGAIVGVIFSFSSVFLINLLASGVLKIPGLSQ